MDSDRSLQPQAPPPPPGEGRTPVPGAAGPLRSGLYAIVDLDACARAGREPVAVARAFCDVRPAALQLRAKRGSDRRLLEIARALAPLCREAGVPFVVNDRADLALLAQADGVHLGQDDLPPDVVRALVGPDRWVGFSSHSRAQVAAAAGLPLDYLGFGPVFTTTTKERADPCVGLAGLREAAAVAPVPLVAIGGIRIADLPAVRAAGARAAALVAALLEGDPAARAREAVQAWEQGPGT